jgi:hypothetical protein
MGANYSVTSCDLRVLMDQPTEPISSDDPPSRRQDSWSVGLERWYLPQGAVRAVAIVVIDVLGQHRPQLPAPEDQHPIKQFTPNGPYPPLGVGVSADSRVRWDNPLYGLVTLPGAFREILAVQQHQEIGSTAGRGGSRCAKPNISVMKQQRVEALGRCRH